jgi:hypothetical protein
MLPQQPCRQVVHDCVLALQDCEYHSLACSLTHSLTRLLTHSLTQVLAKDKKAIKDIKESNDYKTACTYQLNEAGESLPYSLTRSPTHSLAHCDLLLCRVGPPLRECTAVRSLAGHASGPGVYAGHRWLRVVSVHTALVPPRMMLATHSLTHSLTLICLALTTLPGSSGEEPSSASLFTCLELYCVTPA